MTGSLAGHVVGHIHGAGVGVGPPDALRGSIGAAGLNYAWSLSAPAFCPESVILATRARRAGVCAPNVLGASMSVCLTPDWVYRALTPPSWKPLEFEIQKPTAVGIQNAAILLVSTSPVTPTQAKAFMPGTSGTYSNSGF